jgi:hypothetical protein
VDRQAHHLIGQELQGSTGSSRRRARARHRHQQRFVARSQLALRTGPWCIAERLLKAFL